MKIVFFYWYLYYTWRYRYESRIQMRKLGTCTSEVRIRCFWFKKFLKTASKRLDILVSPKNILLPFEISGEILRNAAWSRYFPKFSTKLAVKSNNGSLLGWVKFVKGFQNRKQNGSPMMSKFLSRLTKQVSCWSHPQENPHWRALILITYMQIILRIILSHLFKI